MSKAPKSSAAEDLLESLMKEVGVSETSESSAFENGENPNESEAASSEALSGLISLDDHQPVVNLSLKKNFPPPPSHSSPSIKNSPPPTQTAAPDEKTRLGYVVKPSSPNEVDIDNLPDSDFAANDSPLDIPDPDRMGGGTFDMPDPDRMPGGTFDMPDPDRMGGNDLLDIPDPDRMGGGSNLLDIPDPDMKTSIRDIGDLSKSDDVPSNDDISPEGATRIRPSGHSAKPEVKPRIENTKTINLNQIPENPNSHHSNNTQDSLSDLSFESGGGDSEKTVAVTAFANRNNLNQDEKSKISIGRVRTSAKAGQVFTSSDATLLQAENLRIVQQRVLELENEIDHLRQENEELSSAAEIIKTRADELNSQIQTLNAQKSEAEDSLRSEIMILKGNLQYRDQELSKARIKTEELESRLKMDLKKIRVRERELENRLELARAEKNAIVRSKDESILEAKRKMDQMQNEIDSYRQKCLELNKLLESNHDSFKKTTRALRLALANLELSEEAKSQLKKVD